MGDSIVAQADGQVWRNGANVLMKSHKEDSKFAVEQTTSKVRYEESRKESKEDCACVMGAKVAYEQSIGKKCKRNFVLATIPSSAQKHLHVNYTGNKMRVLSNCNKR